MQRELRVAEKRPARSAPELLDGWVDLGRAAGDIGLAACAVLAVVALIVASSAALAADAPPAGQATWKVS